MKITLDDNQLEMRREQMLRLDGSKGARIACLRGMLWVTQYEDPRDVILPAGESFMLDRGGLALVSALEPSSVQLDEPIGSTA